MAFPYPGIGDTLYRYYNAWIQTPKLKCENIECNTITTGSITQNITIIPSQLLTFNGYFDYGTIFTFTTNEIPSLSNTTCNGELTMYINDLSGIYANITLAYVVKINGSISSTASTVAQRYGNFTSVNLSVSGNTVIITVNPGAVCKWIYRGT